MYLIAITQQCERLLLKSRFLIPKERIQCLERICELCWSFHLLKEIRLAEYAHRFDSRLLQGDAQAFEHLCGDPLFFTEYPQQQVL